MHDQCHGDLTDVHISDSQLRWSDQTWESAKFLLHITEEHHLTHSGGLIAFVIVFSG